MIVRSEKAVSHTCHAPGCKRRVAPSKYACREHWFSLPKKIQDAIWREYRPGQETDKKPSWRYMAVQRLACAYLVFEPNSERAATEALLYLHNAVRYAKMAIAGGLGDPLENIVPKDWPTKPPMKARGRAKTL